MPNPVIFVKKTPIIVAYDRRLKINFSQQLKYARLLNYAVTNPVHHVLQITSVMGQKS